MPKIESFSDHRAFIIPLKARVRTKPTPVGKSSFPALFLTKNKPAQVISLHPKQYFKKEKPAITLKRQKSKENETTPVLTSLGRIFSRLDLLTFSLIG